MTKEMADCCREACLLASPGDDKPFFVDRKEFSVWRFANCLMDLKSLPVVHDPSDLMTVRRARDLLRALPYVRAVPTQPADTYWRLLY